MRSVLLYASETWAATQEDVSRLNRNMMMIRWICSTKLRVKVPSEELRSRLGLESIENALDVGVFVGMVMFNVWTLTLSLRRWTRQSLLVIAPWAAQGRHG